jgi:hypothetical protein
MAEDILNRLVLHPPHEHPLECRRRLRGHLAVGIGQQQGGPGAEQVFQHPFDVAARLFDARRRQAGRAGLEQCTARPFPFRVPHVRFLSENMIFLPPCNAAGDRESSRIQEISPFIHITL